MRKVQVIAVVRQLALCLLMAAMSACQASQPGSANVHRNAGPDPAADSTAARDLSQDESAGGHTLRKHVGRTDEELRERLRRERNISAASTWSDRASAEQAVGAALQHDRERIDRWLSRPGGHPNLVLDYEADHPLGRSLLRGADQPEPCAHATIVLKWLPPGSYYVLTSYPECRS